jgi:hypothetical protein
VANELRAGAVQLDSSVMGPRRVLSAMLRYIPPRSQEPGARSPLSPPRSQEGGKEGGGNAAWVRSHAAAAVGNLAAHPYGVKGELCLKGTYRRALVEGEMFEVVLSAVTVQTGDAAADYKTAQATAACLMFLATVGGGVSGAVGPRMYQKAQLWCVTPTRTPL